LFSNHIAVKKLNIAPASSPIQVQFAVAIGTGMAQMRKKAKGVTIVLGGDAGTAEGEFNSCLLWSSRKNAELPILSIITNNHWGISTPYEGQHSGKRSIPAQAEAYGIKSKTINGNDPEESFREIKTALDYVRTERKPFFLEANVSRLYGHSSSTGCNFVTEETDCIKLFSEQLIKAGVISKADVEKIKEKYLREGQEALDQVHKEPHPAPESIWEDVFCEEE